MSQKLKTTLAAVALVLFGGFAYYTISPIFRVIEINDPMPTAAPLSEEQGTQPTAGGNAPQAAPTQDAERIRGPFEVIGTPGHPASGDVFVIENETGTTIRYENFETLNGPDLFVYLSKDRNATEFINLGRIRGTVGNINYEVPEGVDISQYPYVLTWCRAFRVLFNSAEINP